MTPDDLKKLSRGISDDMSREAIARRLKIARELYGLGKVLSGAEELPSSSSKLRPSQDGASS